MEWINEPDFPAEIQETAINIDKALAEMEECVARLTAVPLADAQSLVINLKFYVVLSKFINLTLSCR